MEGSEQHIENGSGIRVIQLRGHPTQAPSGVKKIININKYK